MTQNWKRAILKETDVLQNDTSPSLLKNLYPLKDASLPFIVCGGTKLYAICQMIEICEQTGGGCWKVSQRK